MYLALCLGSGEILADCVFEWLFSQWRWTALQWFLRGKVISLCPVCVFELVHLVLFYSYILEIWSAYGVWCLGVFRTLVSTRCLLPWNFGFWWAWVVVGSGDFRHSVVWRFGWVAVSSRPVQTSLYLAAWFLCVSTLINRNYRSQCQLLWTPWNIRWNKFMSWESLNSERTSILSMTTKVLENKHRCISHNAMDKCNKFIPQQ